MTPVTVAVEGQTDVPVIKRILAEVGCSTAYVYGRRGKGGIMKNLAGYNRAAQFAPWLVVRDLDGDAACAAELVTGALPVRAKWMRFQIAVRAMEAWLLADAERMARFLSVREDRIPSDPDGLSDPKGFLVAIARHSKRSDIYRDMVPRAGSSGKVGPAYTSRVAEFAAVHWRPAVASSRSESLRRCLNRAGELAGYISAAGFIEA